MTDKIDKAIESMGWPLDAQEWADMRRLCEKVLAMQSGAPVQATPARVASKNELLADVPKKGERWEALHGGGVCRVMCDPVEGYVMARYKGAGPWLLHANDWHKKFKRQNI